MSLNSTEIFTAGQYAFGGVLALWRGDYVSAAKAFILAATSLVSKEDAHQYLSAEGAERQQLIADVAEVVKFGRLS